MFGYKAKRKPATMRYCPVPAPRVLAIPLVSPTRNWWRTPTTPGEFPLEFIANAQVEVHIGKPRPEIALGNVLDRQ